MAEALRQRPVEYYNPRPLILGVCFFWGVAAGFFLFHFSPPKQLADAQPTRNADPAAPAAAMSELERRRQDIPVIADVDLQQDPAAAAAASGPKLETMDLDPPPAILTTEGGLTGKMLRSLRAPPSAGGAARAPTRQPGARPPPPLAPPPIPELMP